jgi:hypothetical protein
MVRSYDNHWQMGIAALLSPGYPTKIPVSAYSLSTTLAYSVGLWDADKAAIGEDFHMFLKCFFGTYGQLNQITVYSPASQSNVDGPNYWMGLKGRYIQSKRHMWASLDVGYTIRRVLFGFFAPGYDAPFDEAVKVPATSAVDFKFFTYLYKSIWILFTIFETHFFISHALIMIASSSVILPPGIIPSVANGYWTFFTSKPVSDELVFAINLANYIRIAGTVFYASGVFFFEYYVAWVGTHRWTLHGEKLGKRSSLSHMRTWWETLDWLVAPISPVFYILIPQMHCHFMQLFSDSLDYVVAAKPSVEPKTSFQTSPSNATIAIVE